jgi:hypothetical protein
MRSRSTITAERQQRRRVSRQHDTLLLTTLYAAERVVSPATKLLTRHTFQDEEEEEQKNEQQAEDEGEDMEEKEEDHKGLQDVTNFFAPRVTAVGIPNKRKQASKPIDHPPRTSHSQGKPKGRRNLPWRVRRTPFQRNQTFCPQTMLAKEIYSQERRGLCQQCLHRGCFSYVYSTDR